ncbi:MAG TPA: glycosyltransferase [Gemmatimonadales bacterium]|nr:glycosyltransferase [Gemmatimonadales bacterium]
MLPNPVLVLHIIAPGTVGGLERVVQLLAQGQAQRGTEVHVAAVLDDPAAATPLLEALAATGVVAHRIGGRGRAYWRERGATRELCRRLRPDVVHTHGYRPDVLDAGVARRLDIPIVTTVHGFTGGDWKNRLYERLQRRAYRGFDAVVAVAGPLAAELVRAGVPAARVHLVRNAWHETIPLLDRAHARRALGIPPHGFHVGWVGRISSEKGADVLVDALAYLGDRPLMVSILGTGPERAPLERRARALGVAARIRWHGAMTDAARLFAAFDVFVLSSRTEGTPIVLFEAMAAGVPIVATRVGGVPDVVSAAEAKLVPADDPSALAAAIRAVQDAPATAAWRAGAARARLAQDFGVAPWLERYETIYAAVRRRALAAVGA